MGTGKHTLFLSQWCYRKEAPGPVTVVHTFNCSTVEAKAERQGARGHPGLHGDSASKAKGMKKEKVGAKDAVQ